MANGRALISAPPFTPLRYGLLSVATDATATAPTHWQAGITWQSHCPDGNGTYDDCVIDNAIGTGTIADPPIKVATTGFDLRGATPFTVYARFDCSAPGFWEQGNDRAIEALTRVEGFEVERIFDTGIAPRQGGSPVTAYPHLRGPALVADDTGAVLQPPVEIITTTPVDIVEALGRLEAALAECYHGQGVIHVPTRVAAELSSNFLITKQGDQLITTVGNRVALGSGYSGGSPTGVVTDDVAWIYATGAVFYYRSDVMIIENTAIFDRSNNTMEALAERQYVIGWDCCLLAIPVYVGGVESGEFDSAGAFTGGS